jgi:hypothetical protein
MLAVEVGHPLLAPVAAPAQEEQVALVVAVMVPSLDNLLPEEPQTLGVAVAQQTKPIVEPPQAAPVLYFLNTQSHSLQ